MGQLVLNSFDFFLLGNFNHVFAGRFNKPLARNCTFFALHEVLSVCLFYFKVGKVEEFDCLSVEFTNLVGIEGRLGSQREV